MSTICFGNHIMKKTISCAQHIMFLAKELHRTVRSVELPASETGESLSLIKLHQFQNTLSQVMGYRHLHELQQNTSPSGASSWKDYSETELLNVREQWCNLLAGTYAKECKIAKHTAQILFLASFNALAKRQRLLGRDPALKTIRQLSKISGLPPSKLKQVLTVQGVTKDGYPSLGALNKNFASVALYHAAGKVPRIISLWNEAYVSRLIVRQGLCIYAEAGKSKTPAAIFRAAKAMLRGIDAEFSQVLIRAYESKHGNDDAKSELSADDEALSRAWLTAKHELFHMEAFASASGDVRPYMGYLIHPFNTLAMEISKRRPALANKIYGAIEGILKNLGVKKEDYFSQPREVRDMLQRFEQLKNGDLAQTQSIALLLRCIYSPDAPASNGWIEQYVHEASGFEPGSLPNDVLSSLCIEFNRISPEQVRQETEGHPELARMHKAQLVVKETAETIATVFLQDNPKFFRIGLPSPSLFLVSLAIHGRGDVADSALGNRVYLAAKDIILARGQGG